MMARATKGSGSVADLTVEILREIRDENRKTNGRLDELKAEMHAGFEGLGKRIDNLLLGEHGREHADFRERLVRVEERLGIHPPADQ
ncbi:MAG: hypothetical protein HY906_11865 [Deltaproteobacteria bacterium]|nr:hypothetical protein [Deltaproteobacteria bacterium]